MIDHGGWTDLDVAAEACAYCGVDPDPAVICRRCWDELDEDDEHGRHPDEYSMGLLGQEDDADDRRVWPVRWAGIDRLRGLAVGLMLVDHAAFFIPGAAAFWTRWTVGRLAMPLFALCLGAVATRPLSRRRALEWAIVAVLFIPAHEAAFGTNAGADLLVFFALSRMLWVRWPKVATGAALFGMTLWANGVDPAGVYDAWAVHCLVGAGVVMAWQLQRYGERLPSWRWLEWTGRQSLWLYVGHVGAIGLVVSL